MHLSSATHFVALDVQHCQRHVDQSVRSRADVVESVQHNESVSGTRSGYEDEDEHIFVNVDMRTTQGRRATHGPK